MVHRLLVLTSLAVATFCVALAAARPTQTPAQAPVRPPAPVIPAFGTGTGALSGIVTDAKTGQPIPGAIVGIAILSNNVVGPSRRQLTDSRGRFAFADLPAANGYIMSARKIGYDSDSPAGRGASPATPRTIALGDGEWKSDLTMRLWRHPAVSGTITDEAGEPVVSAYVVLLARIAIGGDVQLAAGPSQKTDDRGMYRFTNVPPGRYVVSVPSVQWTVPAAATLLTLTGETAERIALIETSGGTVAYRRDPSLVRDPAYRLLSGSFPTPPPFADATGSRPRVYPTWYYPSARQPSQARIVDVTPGDDRSGIDIQIQPVPASTVRGRVEGPAESRTGLTLRLVTDEIESLGAGAEVATALVQPDGEFAFLGVPAGRYAIVATPGIGALQMTTPGAPPGPQPPGAPAQIGRGSSGMAVSAGPAGTFFEMRGTLGASGFFARTAVDVGDADVRGVVVRMQRGVTMTGRLVQEGAAAPPGRGPAVLIVQASPATGRVSLGSPSTQLRPADPVVPFRLEGLQPGEYVLSLSGATRSTAIKSIVWDQKDYTYRPFDTSTGADISDVVITTTELSCQIDGRTTDARGAPVANAVVMYFPVERDQWSKYGFRPSRLRSISVSTGGTFSITRIPAGEYFVIALPESQAERWQDPEFLARAAAQATRVTVNWGETATAALTMKEIK
jgi:hypothetical protein